jgi:hypothetical protein
MKSAVRTSHILMIHLLTSACTRRRSHQEAEASADEREAGGGHHEDDEHADEGTSPRVAPERTEDDRREAEHHDDPECISLGLEAHALAEQTEAEQRCHHDELGGHAPQHHLGAAGVLQPFLGRHDRNHVFHFATSFWG